MNAQPSIDQANSILDGGWDEILPIGEESIPELAEPSFTEVHDFENYC
jgi:hypothetical protein